jgi:glutamate-1-semialdehyde 2,1-aminomutase
MNRSFDESARLLQRALKSIPLGAQTFSKSPTQFPRAVSPHFAAKARGAMITDVDGNEYVDFINALAAVMIGYCDPEIDAAVAEQLRSGVTFSLSHELEIEVAERLVRLVPCAEQVRFGKNGSDATAAAIRLARAYTGRDRVAVCGYHGWQDWYIGTTSRDLGVPRAVKALSHTFTYNDSDSLARLLDTHRGEFAAVILEPLSVAEPRAGFLEAVADLTRAAGALLVFDETVTGFRVHLSGAQGLTGVVPDLATFGKGMANGFPLSAIVGRGRYMALMEKIFFSATFGGETLSLAAARATLDRIEREHVPARLAALGTRLRDGAREAIERAGIGDVFKITGHPSWTFLNIAATKRATQYEIKTLLLQELFARGILSLGTHNLSAAHTDGHIATLLAVYGEVLPFVAERAQAGRVREALRTEPLAPLFAVR